MDQRPSLNSSLINAAPLRSVFTRNLPQLLEQLGISLLISTYQTGKLVILRSHQGKINAHFLDFQKPMGIASDRDRLTIGTATQVWEFRKQSTGEPDKPHNACYVPHHIHTTGNIDIHEMAWIQDQLWLVNTRFSCLCTLSSDPLSSDPHCVPRWHPPFITELLPEDRCHLNGLGVRGDRPRYATALGETNHSRGWRHHKANGGILMDIATNQVLVRNLSMPHSPRWYGDRLWVLESGQGSLATVDPETNQLRTLATLPGFTRGLDFCGNFAFVGLSQARETAIFSGIPITERTQSLRCGVWVVDIRTGKTAAFLRFEEAVQEIFAVSVLGGDRFPEIKLV